jgi:hypothetical protein
MLGRWGMGESSPYFGNWFVRRLCLTMPSEKQKREGVVMRTICAGIALTFAAHASFAQDAPKRLTASDLAVQTHKWDGKKIQANAHCFYADKEDFRCAVLGPNNQLAHSMVRIDFTTVSPPEMKKTVEDNCDTTAQMFTNACRFQILFIYSSNERQEHNDGTVVTSIIAEDQAGEFSRIAAPTPARAQRSPRRSRRL